MTPATVAAIDLGPTLVNLVAPGSPSEFDGLSLLPTIFAQPDALPPQRRWIVSLSAFEDALALIDLERELKLHVHRADRYEQLYDLAADPDELHNLADARPADVAAMMDWLRRFLWHRRHGIGNPFHYRDARDGE